MKVILLKNIDKLGQKNDLKNVSDGYALNYLFPLKLALPVNSANLKNINDQTHKIVARQEKAASQWEKISKALTNKKLVIKKPVSAKGKLFAGVNLEDVLLAIKKSTSLLIDKDQASLGGAHIKDTGSHNITLIVSHHKINLILKVEAE